MRSFVAVADELHFGNAALGLGLSQPQVSRHVANLERELGVGLFTRTPRRTTLTEAGAELLTDARETLAAAERLTRRARVIARGGLGTVNVGFVWSTLAGYLAPLVTAMATAATTATTTTTTTTTATTTATARAGRGGVQLSVTHLLFTELVPALRRGDVDLLITRSLGVKTEFVVTELTREPGVIALPERHPLATNASVTPDQLNGQPLVTLGPEVIPGLFEAGRARLLGLGITPSANHHAKSPSEALALVAAGIGIYYWLPASAAVPQRGVAFRPLQGITARTLLARRPEPPSSAVAAVAELVVELFGDASDASDNAAQRLEASAVTI